MKKRSHKHDHCWHVTGAQISKKTGFALLTSFVCCQCGAEQGVDEAGRIHGAALFRHLRANPS